MSEFSFDVTVTYSGTGATFTFNPPGDDRHGGVTVKQPNSTITYNLTNTDGTIFVGATTGSTDPGNDISYTIKNASKTLEVTDTDADGETICFILQVIKLNPQNIFNSPDPVIINDPD
jgi:hypothetical protein